MEEQYWYPPFREQWAILLRLYWYSLFINTGNKEQYSPECLCQLLGKATSPHRSCHRLKITNIFLCSNHQCLYFFLLDTWHHKTELEFYGFCHKGFRSRQWWVGKRLCHLWKGKLAAAQLSGLLFLLATINLALLQQGFLPKSVQIENLSAGSWLADVLPPVKRGNWLQRSCDDGGGLLLTTYCLSTCLFHKPLIWDVLICPWQCLVDRNYGRLKWEVKKF